MFLVFQCSECYLLFLSISSPIQEIMDPSAHFVGHYHILHLQNLRMMPERSSVYVSLVCDVAVMHARILPDIIIYF